jgi:hypothetical protein
MEDLKKLCGVVKWQDDGIDYTLTLSVVGPKERESPPT